MVELRSEYQTIPYSCYGYGAVKQFQRSLKIRNKMENYQMSQITRPMGSTTISYISSKHD